MNSTKKLVEKIVEGIQEKKGHDIKVVDLSGIEDTVCRAFVICTGGSPTQVQAIADSVEETVRKTLGQKPTATDGLRHAMWVAMDYTDVIVHIFLPETRDFYDLEHLWADAKITSYEDE